ncbi:unnamed protein product, partial [Schistosoma margrebowiei]
DILNLILFRFQYILYEIPCEWNIQLSAGSDEQRCPVSWLTYAELKKRNYTTIVKQPKLIHINHLTKPDDIIANYTPTEYIDQSDVILKRTWNVRTMWGTGRALQIAAETRSYNLEVLGINETHWTHVGQRRLTSGELL